MITPAINLLSVSVRYGGTAALQDVTFSVARGSVFALVGRNGSGKSSAIHALLGLQRPSRGICSIEGIDSWRHRAKALAPVGYVAEGHPLPAEQPVRALARLTAACHPRWNQRSFDGRLDRVGVNPAARCGQLSKGQRAQVALGLALACEPSILVLDDPMLGLDVVARDQLIVEIIDWLSAANGTVLLTSHDLPAVERLATHVGLLRDGRLIDTGEIGAVKSRFRRIRGRTAHAWDPDTLRELVPVSLVLDDHGIDAVVASFSEPALQRWAQTCQVRDVETEPLSLAEIVRELDGGVR